MMPDAAQPPGSAERLTHRSPLTLSLRDIGRDLRFGLRTLAKSRAFTLVAILSLALGIGVNTALFTVFHATWLKPVAGISGADRVIELLITRLGTQYEAASYPDFQDLRETETPIEALAGWKQEDGSLTTEDGSQHVSVMYVSANYFRVLGVSPARGRDFLAAEDVGPGQHPVAVLSHDMWQNRFAGDADIVGKTITLNRALYTVVGVAPQAFKGHRPISGATDLWAPMMQNPWVAGPRNFLRDREALWLRVLGRLRAGATVDEANAALQTVFARLESDYPESNRDRRARAAPFGPVPANGRAATLVETGMLFTLAGLVLLIICGNLAGMVLARSVTREREIAVRMALGSGRGRLVRQLMAEALILALAGGAVGVLLAFWVTDVSSPAGLVPAIPGVSFGPNLTILAFSLALTLATTLAFGLLPALRFSRPDLVSSLKDDSGGGGRRVGRVHRIAASAQTGLALSLLVVCTLFVRALGLMERRDLGFEPRDLLVARLDLSLAGYESLDEGEAFMNRLRGSVGSLPGVASLSVADGLPLDLIGNYTSVSRADRADEPGGRLRVEFTRATEGFFQTIATPILRGRGIEPTDEASSEPVVVITTALAEQLWPGEDALGRQLRFALSTDEPQAFTVVGVVGHVASSRPTEDWPHVFVALRQHYRPRITLVVRGAADATALIRPVQSAILDADPGLPLTPVITSESLVARSTEGQRGMVRMAGGLGLLALILSAIGVYGVVAFAVAHRTREIGLRMALGATRERVLGSVVRDAVRLAVPSLAVGALLAVAMAASFGSMLLGLSPVDPLSLALAAGTLFLVVILASLVPARRASGVQPMEALRSE
jgi:predicted permease